MIELHALTKQFGGFTAVNNLSFRVDQGSIYGFLGPNGAGKTTTIKLLMGLLVPSSGRAQINQLDCQTDRIELKRHIGYLPDNPQFAEFLKAREVVQMAAELHGFSRQEARKRASELLDFFSLSESSEEFGSNYSTGMKKRLGLCCALVHNPAVLILDEPANGLDPRASKHMRDWIVSAAAQGKTILLSTHLLDMAERICSHVGIIWNGELVSDGTVESVMAQRSQSQTLEEVFFAVTGSDDAI